MGVENHAGFHQILLIRAPLAGAASCSPLWCRIVQPCAVSAFYGWPRH